MSNTNIRLENLKDLFLSETPLIDVRAPVEFKQGSLPGAVNFPILNDEERALIGTTYKQDGQEAAVKLGYQLISGSVKEERVQSWKSFIARYPSAVLYCFRGGKRSQITQQWLKEAGIERPLIVGGYKVSRHFLLDQIERFSKTREMLVVSGPTGSGKTQFLKEVAAFYPTIDLEALAQHRGSAFGSLDENQPSQIDFENRLAVTLLKIEDKGFGNLRPIVEDESRLIGRIYQPTPFFEHLRSSQVIWLDEPLEVRVENIFKDYILSTSIGLIQNQIPRCAEEDVILRSQALKVFEKYKSSLRSISRKLGGLRTQEVMADLENSQSDFLNKNEIASNKIWIEKLLKYYYDPLYLSSLERRQVSACFKGSSSSAVDFLKNLKP
ncbi:tRNA 2-selenouridine(34) synthase MnmH [Bdellovibrio sp. HCB-110]|uniref:tRNA 2-selenouridine(34) synthase MnmH n=1 Tax=Bdellovibrio sp. HCB-110 TaxID=3391182 RepID=UPI0039B4E5B0